MKNSFLILAAAVAFAGCESIRNAEEAQARLAPKALEEPGETPAPVRVDLTAMNLSELVDFALTNRPSMAVAAWELEDARLALRAIDANAPLISENPWNAFSSDLTAGYSESSDRSHGLTWRKRGKPSASLSVDLLIWDWGRNRAEALAQAERILAAEQTMIDEGFAVFGEVSSAYFGVLSADAMLEIAQTNEVVNAIQAERAYRRMEAGETKLSDYLQAKKNLAAARELTVVRRDAVKTAEAKLVKALGLDAMRASRREIVRPAERPLDVYRRAFPSTSGTLEETFAFALTNAPSMRIARARLRAASQDVDAAKADFMPRLALSGSVNWTDPLWMWSWGVNLTQNLFSGFRTTTALDRAVAKMETASVQIDEAAQALSKSLADAIATRDDARISCESAAATYEAAKENFEAISQQYLVGECNQLDYADAVNTLITAMGDRVESFYTGQVAESGIYRLTGEYPVYEFAEEEQ